MKRVSSFSEATGLLVLLATAATVQAQTALVSSRTEALGPLIAGTPIATQKPALPADAAQLMVLTCVYQGGQKQHYWLREAPSWQRAIPAGHPLNRLVVGAETRCPAAPRDQSSLSGGSSATVVAPPATMPPAQPVERAKVPLPSFELTPADFKATGLEFEQAFMGLYLGNFGRVTFERDRPEMAAMMKTYIDVFGNGCAKFLPSNAVPVMKQVCTHVWSNSGSCANWESRPSGYFADPGVYEAYRGLERLAATKAFGEVMAIFQGGLSGLADKVQVVRSMNVDMTELIKMNGCGSRGLRRFQENMRLYAENKQPIVMAGGAGSAPTGPATPAPAPVTNHNFTKMLDDMVDANSRSWALNRYYAGSMQDVRVASRDAQGRPRRVTGKYTYEGFTGRSNGTVALEFSDGVPQCLFFWDFPTACRTPDRSISSAYANGKYATQE